jgi:hypothetical protein
MSELGGLHLRLGHLQSAFAAERAHCYDRAIIQSRYLSPDPEATEPPSAPADALALAVVAAGTGLTIDPGTPMLTSRGVTSYRSARRVRAVGAASAVQLPLTLAQLSDSSTREEFVDATMQDQRLADVIAAPYLEEGGRQADLKHALNLEMLRRVVRSTDGRPPVAFVVVTTSSLLQGVVAARAAAYAATGVRTVFLRVRGSGEGADQHEAIEWMAAIDAFARVGVDVIADCVGRMGPVLMHVGAAGFSTGTDHFRTAAKPLLAKGGGGGGSPITIELPAGLAEVERDDVQGVAPCPVAGCLVGRGTPSLDDLREHRLHTWDRLVDQLSALPSIDVVRRLRASGQPQASLWADALEERARRAA